jgi:predicted GNAT family acetyltransferase
VDDAISHEIDARGGAFTIVREGKRIAELTYVRSGESVIVINHTFVDQSLRGQGIARKLLDAAVVWARTNQVRIIPECSYARVVFARDASVRDVLACGDDPGSDACATPGAP